MSRIYFNARRIRIFVIAVIACTATSAAIRAQKPMEPPKDPNSKVATVDVTPAQANAAIGDKLQFKAVGKDAAGNPLPDKVEFWFAAPTDLGGSNADGVVSLFGPGEVVVGATIGGTTGYAIVTVSKPHIATIELAPQIYVMASGTRLLAATPRNKNGDPRTDIALTWTSSDSSIATVDAAGLLRGGKPGKARIKATGDGASAESEVTVAANPVTSLAISPTSASAKTGDVIHFAADAKGAKGSLEVAWSVQGAGAQIFPDGAFVAERPGTYRVEGSIGNKTAVASVVVAPRDIEREIEVVGHAMPKDEQFAEEWIWDHYAYVSTIDDKVLVYDISDPANPKPGETLKVDARLVNDVSITPDGKIGVISREGASNRKNGIAFLDTSNPMKPSVISEYTATVTGGVHSAYVNSHYVYLTDDATGSLRVIDFADVKSPKEVARWEVAESAQMQVRSPEGVGTAGRYLHDVQVIDGLAYLAYWRDGLVILDVGNGMKGGSPEHPQFISHLRFNYNELYGPGWLAGAHAVYRYKNYIFVGDEVFPSIFKLDTRDRIPVRGIAHVVDVSDLKNLREVATYSVPEAGSHNIWVFDDVLYMGYYNGGARVLDVSGELRGELYNQGREIGRFWSADAQGYRANLPFAWGAYPHRGLIYINDVHGGLWITKLGKHKPYTSTTDSPH